MEWITSLYESLWGADALKHSVVSGIKFFTEHRKKKKNMKSFNGVILNPLLLRNIREEPECLVIHLNTLLSFYWRKDDKFLGTAAPPNSLNAGQNFPTLSISR